jgi:hypothetical protein
LWREFRKGSNSKNGKIKKPVFIKILNKYVKLPNDNIAEQLFKSKKYSGFGIRKYKEKGQVEHRAKKIELHDIMLALTLLSRIPNDKKVELIFDLTDVDEDGCLSPDEIYKMIEVIERIFAKENTEMKIESRILLEELSKDKALRRYDWVMRSVGMLKSRSKNDEGLITFDEFQNVLNKVPNLKAQFLPRYTDIKLVLKNDNSEPDIKVEENMLEDFLVFRYELQVLLDDSLKSNRKSKSSSIQKSNNTQKNVKYVKKECPGLINEGKVSKKLDIHEDYWELGSTSNGIMVRDSEKKTSGVRCLEKEKAIEKIIPQRPVQKALQAIKEKHDTNQHYKNDDEEAAGYDTLVSKVISQVADTKKKKIEIGEVQTITRKSDLKTFNERGNFH